MSTALTSKHNDCRSCYKCIRRCPVKSISFHDGQASIIPEECVLCGACYLVCPQSCKIIRDDLGVAKSLLANNQEVIASVAPSFLGAYPEADFSSFKSTLLKLGFSDVEETAIGATIVKKQYDELCHEKENDVIISTCCHSVNLLIEKHYPEATKFLAPILSPMLMHAKDIKARHPNAKVIFIGPCISKKNEIEMYPGYDDCVLTFLELDRFLEEKGLTMQKAESEEKREESLARLFPVEGGILDTMKKDNPDYTYLAVAGMEECISALEDILSGKVHHAFIEMSSCEGSCINGPAMKADARSLLASYLKIKRSAGKKDFEVASYTRKDTTKTFFAYSSPKKSFSEKQIEEVLAKLGKVHKSDELNCSSCGYASCRDKAVAVLEGKANLEMCLPYLMEKATNFSNSIVEGSADPIVALDEEMKIQLANPSMASLTGAASPHDLIGKDIASIMDGDLFALALGGQDTRGKKIYLPEYGTYLMASVSYNSQFHLLIGVFRDVTKEEKNKSAEREVAAETARITSEVVDKNMRAVQEIAQLLGESTASTKLALTKLENVIKKQGKDDD